MSSHRAASRTRALRASRWRWRAITAAALLAVAALLFSISNRADLELATGAPASQQPSPAITVTAGPIPMPADPRPIAQLAAGDKVLYRTSNDDRGNVCTYESTTDAWSRVDCGAGRVKVRTTQLLSMEER